MFAPPCHCHSIHSISSNHFHIEKVTIISWLWCYLKFVAFHFAKDSLSHLLFGDDYDFDCMIVVYRSSWIVSNFTYPFFNTILHETYYYIWRNPYHVRFKNWSFFHEKFKFEIGLSIILLDCTSKLKYSYFIVSGAISIA